MTTQHMDDGNEYLLLIDAETVVGPDDVDPADLTAIANVMDIELAEEHRVAVRAVRPGESAGLYLVDNAGRPIAPAKIGRDLLCFIDDAQDAAKTIVWPAGIDREHRDRVMLAHLAKREGWVDYRSGLDVPSTADWLVASAHKLDARAAVMDALGSLCRGTMTFDEASAELDKVLS